MSFQNKTKYHYYTFFGPASGYHFLGSYCFQRNTNFWFGIQVCKTHFLNKKELTELTVVSISIW